MTVRRVYSLPETRAVIEALTAVRTARGLSQSALGGLMGAPQTWVSDIEKGAVPDPQFSTIVRLARALDVTAALTIYDPRTGDFWLLSISS